MRQSAVVFNGRFNGQVNSTRFGKSRLKYVFTMEGVTLSCGSALLLPTSEGAAPPTVSLTWTSGRKKVFGGVVRALPAHEGSGARWPRPVSMACSLTSNKRGANSFEPRHSTITLRIEGTKASRRKLVGTLDLAQHASYERSSTKLTIPLEHGAGSLQLDLTAGWLKKSVLDDEEGSECSFSSRASDSVNGDGSGSDDGGHMDESLGGGLSHPGDGNLSSLKEDVVSQWAQESAAHAPSTALGGTPPRPGGMLRSGSFDRALARKATGLPSKRGSPGGPSPSCAEPVCNRRNSDGGAAALEIAGTMVRSNSFGAMGARGHRRVASSGADAVQKLRNADAEGGACGGNGGSEHGGSLHGGSRMTRSASFQDGFANGGSPERAGAPSAAGAGVHGSPSAAGAASASMFNVPLEAMEEVLHMQLPLALDEIQEAFSGFDTDDSRFGQMLSRRLGYMDVAAGSWSGNEAEGMARQVQMVVKCPPKPMLPDTTRVHIRHRLQRVSHAKLLLEREVATLDVPYGETWSLQERWVVAADPDEPERAIELSVCSHIYFKSRGARLAPLAPLVAMVHARWHASHTHTHTHAHAHTHTHTRTP